MMRILAISDLYPVAFFHAIPRDARILILSSSFMGWPCGLYDRFGFFARFGAELTVVGELAGVVVVRTRIQR